MLNYTLSLSDAKWLPHLLIIRCNIEKSCIIAVSFLVQVSWCRLNIPWSTWCFLGFFVFSVLRKITFSVCCYWYWHFSLRNFSPTLNRVNSRSNSKFMHWSLFVEISHFAEWYCYKFTTISSPLFNSIIASKICSNTTNLTNNVFYFFINSHLLNPWVIFSIFFV